MIKGASHAFWMTSERVNETIFPALSLTVIFMEWVPTWPLVGVNEMSPVRLLTWKNEVLSLKVKLLFVASVPFSSSLAVISLVHNVPCVHDSCEVPPVKEGASLKGVIRYRKSRVADAAF